MKASWLIPSPAATPRPDEAELRAVVEELADIERAPASPGEREAAHIIAGRFQGLGLRVEVEDEHAFGSYASPAVASAVAAAAGLIAGRTPQRRGVTPHGGRSGSLGGSLRRAAGTLGGALAAAGITDEISLGQAIRRLVSPRRTTCNVVGYVGDQSAERTLVVMAHHDAAPSGVVFDQRLERWFAARYPGLVERMTENPPLWWPVVAGPALVAIGSALPFPSPAISRGVRVTGTVMSAIAAAAFADIGLRRPVPGANDNLSAVAVLVALRRRSASGRRTDCVSSCSPLARKRHCSRARAPSRGGTFPRCRASARPSSIWTRSGRDGCPARWRGPAAHGALRPRPGRTRRPLRRRAGIFLHRGLRSRNSTDGVVPMPAGYPTATLVSVDDAKLLPHYHLYSDTPENVDYRCVADAAQLVQAVAYASGAPLA